MCVWQAGTLPSSHLFCFLFHMSPSPPSLSPPFFAPPPVSLYPIFLLSLLCPPSTLETTFDDSVTTEISRGGKAILNMPPRPASTLPWRLGASSPRLQAGDAPSTVGSYGVAAGGGVSRVPTPKGGKYLRRPWPAGRDIGDITPDHALLLADKMEELEGITVETTGYVSDGELLGKNARMDHMTSG